MTYKMSVRQSKKLFDIVKLIDFKKLSESVDFKEIGIKEAEVEAIKQGDLENINLDNYVGATGKIVGALVEIVLEQSDEIYMKFNEFLEDITKKEKIEDLELEEYIDLIVVVFKDINFQGIFKKYGSSITSKLKAFFTPK